MMVQIKQQRDASKKNTLEKKTAQQIQTDLERIRRGGVYLLYSCCHDGRANRSTISETTRSKGEVRKEA